MSIEGKLGRPGLYNTRRYLGLGLIGAGMVIFPLLFMYNAKVLNDITSQIREPSLTKESRRFW